MLIAMKLFKRVEILFLILPLMALFEACGSAIPSPFPATATAPTATLVILTSTELHPTLSPTLTPSAIPVSSPPDGLRMAYIIDGNLYFQDGSNPPVQLTYSAEDSTPIFSDDGEKIIFRHGKHAEEIHSINIDSSQEQVLVTDKLLMTLDTLYNESTYVHSLTFIPGTHLLLFGTHESLSDMPRWNNDLLMVNADTAEIKRLLLPNHVGSFYVSPDGKFIAIDTIGRIDVIDLGGKVIHQNVLTYTPSEPIFLPPGISWMPDSQGLVVILPVSTFYDTSASGPSYTVWLYTLDDGTGVQAPLDILPTEVYMANISPDGSWIIYNNNDQYAFYIGDLRTGNTQLYEPKTFVFHDNRSWSPDSKHFIYRGTRKNLFLGSVNNPPELIGRGDFLGWLDANRYLYYLDKNIVMGGIDGGQSVLLADVNGPFSNTIFSFILLP